MKIEIPGYKTLHLIHLVLDFNGTIACDGKLITGVKEKLQSLAHDFHIHVLTADTFGTVGQELKGIPCTVSMISEGAEELGKREYITRLGCEHVVCMGNGRNDRLMLEEAALGIAVIQAEGAATEAIMAADVVMADILDALNLLTMPLRLIATLRS